MVYSYIPDISVHDGNALYADDFPTLMMLSQMMKELKRLCYTIEQPQSPAHC